MPLLAQPAFAEILEGLPAQPSRRGQTSLPEVKDAASEFDGRQQDLRHVGRDTRPGWERQPK